MSAFPLLLAFWVFVGWRVRVERGRVHSPFRAYLLAMRRLERQLAEALRPAVEHVVKQMIAFNRRWAEAVAAEATATDDLPDG